MLRNSVVLITTICSSGTGLLYPCKYKKKTEHVNYYIVFTNRHILKDIGDNEQNQNVKELVNLLIYDDTGKAVDRSDIEEIRVFNPKWMFEKKEDIAALLVAINDRILITLNRSVFRGDPENRSILYTEGYPGILADDEVNKKIQLQGISKRVFPENRAMGIFQITDDYHWYNNLQDNELLGGMSGSPVYMKSEGEVMILGMNQSVSVSIEGHNPFKLVYYLKMEYILECLREEGCILFQRISEAEYQIEWVYGFKEEMRRYANKPSFLLIGGSGAGKSSFARDFAYHGDKLLSTNDGQTTRTAITYEYQIFCDKPKVTVEFMNQDEFCERMSVLQGAMPAIRVIQKIFGIGETIEKDEMLFLQNCQHIIRYLQNSDVHAQELQQDIENYTETREKEEKISAEDLIRTYEVLVELLMKYVPVSMVKYICDKNVLDQYKRSYQYSYEKQQHLSEEQHTLINKMATEVLQGTGITEADIISEYADILKRYFEGEISFYGYQDECMDFLKRIKNLLWDLARLKGIAYERSIIHKVQDKLNEFQSEYIQKLLDVEGFFGINEFRFLETFCNLSKDFWNTFDYGGGVFLFDEREETEQEVLYRDIGIWNGTQNVYRTVHSKLKEAIQKEYGIEGTVLKREFDLAGMNELEKRQLQLCLQVTGENSLTGIIRSVKVEDMVSNEYAMLMSELQIAKITMIDTYGLDHIGGIESMQDALYRHIYYLTEKEKIQFKNMNVLYLKKLDSGKPDELRNILPCVRKVIPQAPLYCVFTGIDIFYRTPEEVRGICWKKRGDAIDDKLPKAVRYILSERGRAVLVGNEAGTTEKNMYLVLRNNLVPYCGNRELVRNQYDYYKNNVTYVRTLLVSIIMKEYSSLEIVDIEQFEGQAKEVVDDIEQFILNVFKRASVSGNSLHWNTIRANVRKIRDGRLGAYTSFRYQWNQRFHEAYAFVVAQEGAKLAEKFEFSKEAIESALRNVEDLYLGSADNLCNIEVTDKNKFRELLEIMYRSKRYKYNIFEISEEKYNEILEASELRKELFKDVFDFAKGIKEDHELLRKFAEEFIGALTEQIKSDNEEKEQNMIHLDMSFAEVIERLQSEFIEKYEWDKADRERANKNFKEMLKSYISSI